MASMSAICIKIEPIDPDLFPDENSEEELHTDGQKLSFQLQEDRKVHNIQSTSSGVDFHPPSNSIHKQREYIDYEGNRRMSWTTENINTFLCPPDTIAREEGDEVSLITMNARKCINNTTLVLAARDGVYPATTKPAIETPTTNTTDCLSDAIVSGNLEVGSTNTALSVGAPQLENTEIIVKQELKLEDDHYSVSPASVKSEQGLVTQPPYPVLLVEVRRNVGHKNQFLGPVTSASDNCVLSTALPVCNSQTRTKDTDNSQSFCVETQTDTTLKRKSMSVSSRNCAIAKVRKQAKKRSVSKPEMHGILTVESTTGKQQPFCVTAMGDIAENDSGLQQSNLSENICITPAQQQKQFVFEMDNPGLSVLATESVVCVNTNSHVSVEDLCTAASKLDNRHKVVFSSGMVGTSNQQDVSNSGIMMGTSPQDCTPLSNSVNRTIASVGAGIHSVSNCGTENSRKLIAVLVPVHPVTAKVCIGQAAPQAVTSNSKIHDKKTTGKSPVRKNINADASGKIKNSDASKSCRKNYHKFSLAKHVRITSGKREYVCDVCCKIFLQKSELVSDLKSHCASQKTQSFNTVARKNNEYGFSLLKHFRVYDGKKEYVCDVCSKAFQQKTVLISHLKTHNEPEMVVYTCDECKYTSFHRHAMERHKKKHRGEWRYKCDTCNKTFYERSQLRIHQRSHSDERPYVCDICKKCFRQRPTLATHMITHSGTRPFACSLCHCTFTGRSSLIYHMRSSHTGERPFLCEVCGQSFILKPQLNAHIKMHSL